MSIGASESQPPSTTDAAHRRKQLASGLGLLVNAVLAGVKLAAGIFGHSYALIADAAESITDIAASTITLGGLRWSAKPADDDHPYGHGKAEAIAALIVAAMLLLAGIGIAIQAVREIVTPHTAPAPFTIWVLIAVVIIKETVFRIQRRVASETDSSAVHTDAWHNRSDAITSAAAGIGIAVSLIGGKGYEAADDWGALAASAVVLYNAWTLLLTPLHELMDAAPTDLIERCRAAAEAVEGVRLVEKTFARKSGSMHHVDMHVHVDPRMSVHDAHIVSGKVKAAVKAAIPSVANVLIHIEPAE